jgi:hypothetical protein
MVAVCNRVTCCAISWLPIPEYGVARMFVSPMLKMGERVFVGVAVGVFVAVCAGVEVNVGVEVGCGVNVGVWMGVEVSVAVGPGVRGVPNSKAPMSHPAPCGRIMPR